MDLKFQFAAACSARSPLYFNFSIFRKKAAVISAGFSFGTEPRALEVPKSLFQIMQLAGNQIIEVPLFLYAVLRYVN
jgi:hypothetical protein